MSFKFKSETVSNCRIFHFEGSFIDSKSDTSLISDFYEAVDSGEKNFIFDLEKLDYMSSSGINELVKMVNRVNQNSANLVFVSVPNKILELLSIIKLNSVLTIRESIEEGVDALKAEE